MGTKIKPVKCPNCGSGLHTQLDAKRYLCQNCGTEYYIDDDDININVNHHHEYSYRCPQSNSSSSFSDRFAWIFYICFVVGFLLFMTLTCTNSTDSMFSSDKDSVKVSDNYDAIVPMLHKGKPCFFYICRRDFGYNSNYTDGIYYGFRDANTGAVLTDKLLVSEEEAERQDRMDIYRGNLAYFHQAKRWYLAVPNRYVFEIDPNALSMTETGKKFFSGKPALSSGISMIDMLDDRFGEGFKVTNNLAVTYYFFPATGRLYTEDAFSYASKLPPAELNGEIRDSVCYRLEKENANSRTDAGGKYRLCRLKIKFHLGDPQNIFIPLTNGRQYYDEGERIIDVQPVSDWFPAFNAKVIYQDNQYVLIVYHPNISDNAPTVFQLWNTKGNVIWTQSPDTRIKVDEAIRDKQKIWLRGVKEIKNKGDENYCYSLDLQKGSWKCHYKFPDDYSITK